jgi:hypothetical protein
VGTFDEALGWLALPSTVAALSIVVCGNRAARAWRSAARAPSRLA